MQNFAFAVAGARQTWANLHQFLPPMKRTLSFAVLGLLAVRINISGTTMHWLKIAPEAKWRQKGKNKRLKTRGKDGQPSRSPNQWEASTITFRPQIPVIQPPTHEQANHTSKRHDYQR